MLVVKQSLSSSQCKLSSISNKLSSNDQDRTFFPFVEDYMEREWLAMERRWLKDNDSVNVRYS